MKQLQFSDKFVIRTPLFPLSHLETFEQFWDEGNLAFEDALFLASPNLTKKLHDIRQDRNPNPEELEAIKRSVYKYWIRAHSRCTPFGLFAACSIGNWGPKTDMKIPPAEDLYRSTRLDMNYLCHLAKSLEGRHEIQSQLRFFPNSSLYQLGSQLRYVYYTYDGQNNRAHQLNEVECSEYVSLILTEAKEGKTLESLAKQVVDEDISIEEARLFIDQFVQAQLLVSELEVAIAGPEYLEQLLTSLQQLPQQSDSIQADIHWIKKVQQQLNRLDDRQFNLPIHYKGITETLEQMGLSYDPSKLFQVDSFLKSKTDCSLPKKLQRDIAHALDFLHQFVPSIPNQDLSQFVSAYKKRYEGKKMKLVHVLDTESGIGFPVADYHPSNNPIVKEIAAHQIKAEGDPISLGRYEQALIGLLDLAQATGASMMDLQPIRDQFVQQNKPSKPLAPSIALMGNVLGKNEHGELQFKLGFAGGSSGTYLLSRFAHGSSEIHAWIQSLVEQEQQSWKDVLLAEIVHLPQARTGNILMHPPFLAYDICYLAKGSEAAHHLSLDDLEICVESGNRIVLWSQAYQKEVIPRLSNAHQHAGSALPIYRFLCALQYHQIEQGLSFSWGKLAQVYTHFPRMCFGNIILKEAQWILRKSSFDALSKKHGSAKKAFEAFQRLYHIPPRFLLVEGDNQLLIDTKNPMSMDIFLGMIDKREQVNLSEFLFEESNAVSLEAEGRPYTNEIIGVLFNRDFHLRGFKKLSINHDLKETFFPGSEWLYVNIYCGEKTSDRVLMSHIAPLIEQLKEENWISEWFFIRYADPDTHLRLRLHVNDQTCLGNIQTYALHVFEHLSEQGLIHRVRMDTYEREIDRYGLQTMALSETWFCLESKHVLHFLTHIEGERGEEYRWQYALVSIDQILTLFEFDIQHKAQLTTDAARLFSSEFQLDKSGKKGLSSTYRQHRSRIAELIEQRSKGEAYVQLYDMLAAKRMETHELCANILRLVNQGQESPSMSELVCSYIHMFCNRIFPSNQRLHEWVMYELLARYYTGVLAREKNQTSKKPFIHP